MVTYPEVFAGIWEEKSFDDIGDVLTGLTYSPDNIRAFGKLVIRSSNVQDDRLVYEDNVFVERSCVSSEDIRKGDIIICVRNGSSSLIGKSAYADSDLDATFGAFMSNFRCRDVRSSRFVYYFTKSNDFKDFVKQILGATINQITKTDLKKVVLKIPVETLEQEAIASVLSNFDEHIDNLTELIEKKKAIRDGALEDLVSGKTRLDGFDGEWEAELLGKTLKYTQPTNYIENNFATNGSIPVLTAGKSFVLGYSERSNKAYKNLPAILFDDFTTEVRYLDYPFMVKSSATKFLNVISDRFDIKFLYYWLKQLNFQVEAHERHWISRFSKFTLSLPHFSEQQAIAETLTAMDEEIESLEEEKAKMVQIREGAMDDLLTGRVRLKV